MEKSTRTLKQTQPVSQKFQYHKAIGQLQKSVIVVKKAISRLYVIYYLVLVLYGSFLRNYILQSAAIGIF